MPNQYKQIESDERAENEDRLEFKSFLGNEGASQNNGTQAAGHGYVRDQPSSSFWNPEFYQHYFDIDTQTVLKRCYSTLLPTSTDYLTTHLNPVDLYGPFWTLTTVIFSLFVFSSLAESVTSYLSGNPFAYDFQKLSIAVSLVYAYGIGLPTLLWLALKYLGVSEWSVAEAVAIFGYSQFVWIPVSLLCIIPVPIVRWVCVGIAFGMSGYFLFANVYPVLTAAEAKATRLLAVIIFILHATIAICFKLLFFSAYIVPPIGGDDPLGGSTDPTTPDVPTTTSDLPI